MPAIESKHVQHGSQPVAIAYIGNKEIKQDTQCRTGVTWYGQFNVQAVDPVPASRLLKFPSVWIRAEDLDKYKESIEATLVEDEKEEVTASETESNTAPAEPEKEDATGESGVDRTEAIQTVILSMDQENPDHFTSGGKPKIEAVRARMTDCEISTAEVTEAWKKLDAGQQLGRSLADC